MIHCQNCGQASSSESNFCRFCGARIVLRERADQSPGANANSAPRPYMWKTDEFQVTPAPARRPSQINQVQPLQNLRQNSAAPPALYPPPAPYQQSMLYQQQSAPLSAFSYRCPRCAAQTPPRFVKKISPAGWIVFAALLVVFFPLFWIGLLIKEDVRICPVCNGKVG